MNEPADFRPARWLRNRHVQSVLASSALRVALRAPAAGIELAWAFAVCPAISPRATLQAIEDSPWFYELYFLRKWRNSLKRKQRLFPQMQLFTGTEMQGNLRELTRNLV